MNDDKEKLNIKEIEEPKEFKEFLESEEDILLMPEDDFREGHRVLKPEAYQLAKWVRQNQPEIKINVQECEEKIDLKSEEIWLPLIFVSQHMSLPLALNAIYDYIKFKIKGLLNKEKPKVHLSIICKEGKKTKKISYDGPVSGFEKFKDFDINKFMED